MRHKHASRSGSSSAGTSIRDRYGFEVLLGAAPHGCVHRRAVFNAVVHPIRSCYCHRSRRTCLVSTKTMLLSGRKKSWNVQNAGMPSWRILKLHITKTQSSTCPAAKSLCVRVHKDAIALKAKCMCRKQSKASPLDLLEQACQNWPPGERGLGHNSTDWQHQLRSLVQAGIPMVCSMHLSKDTVDKPSMQYM